MIIRDALVKARAVLEEAHIEDAALEAEVLLRFVLDEDRAYLFANPEEELSDADYDELMEFLERRVAGEPVAYITGTREFYGLDFRVDPSVLIPRPETELLVDTAIEIANQYSYKQIADIGTGSGCVAISIARNVPGAGIIAVDVSAPALKTAEANAVIHGVRCNIMFFDGDLLEPLPGKVNMIVANLPYVTASDMASVNTLGFEPDSALLGGEDGLDFIRRLVRESKDYLNPGGTLLLEIGIGQAEAVVSLLGEIFPDKKPEVLKDLAGIDRVIRLTLSPDSRLNS